MNAPPCGTDRGYQAHRRAGEDACASCRAAHAVYEQDRRAVRRASRPAAVRELVPCGTASAWRRHRRRREDPCEPCRAAHVAESVASRSRSRGRRSA